MGQQTTCVLLRAGHCPLSYTLQLWPACREGAKVQRLRGRPVFKILAYCIMIRKGYKAGGWDRAVTGGETRGRSRWTQAGKVSAPSLTGWHVRTQS